jgi:flavorubredoxin
MWGSTAKIARALQTAFENKGIRARMLPLGVNHISDIMTEVLTARYICVGSPTLNNGMLPTVSSFLTYLKGLAPKERVGLAFGSYGWGGQSISQVEEVLRSCGFELLDKIKVQYVPDQNTLQKITDNLQAKLP